MTKRNNSRPRPSVIPQQRPSVISSEAEKSKPAVGSRGTYGSAALALNPPLSVFPAQAGTQRSAGTRE